MPMSLTVSASMFPRGSHVLPWLLSRRMSDKVT